MKQSIVMFETSSLIDVAQGILNKVTEIQELVEVLKELTRLKRVKVVYTHIQVDEIRNDAEIKTIRQFFEEINAELIPTTIAVWGISRWGKSSWGRELENQLYEQLRTPTSKGSWLKDLIQALTATKVDILVTSDNGIKYAMTQIRKKYGEEMQCETYNLKDFSQLIKAMER